MTVCAAGYKYFQYVICSVTIAGPSPNGRKTMVGDNPPDDENGPIDALTAEEPPDKDTINSPEMAAKALDAYTGQTILRAHYARLIAEAFDIQLQEGRELEKISKLNQARPEDSDLGIAVGALCMRIAEGLNDVEAEDYDAAGAGFTQDGRKRQNLPKIKQHILTDGSSS